MTITLKVGLKDGKTPIEAIIEGLQTEHVLGEYERLLERFPAGNPPPAKPKKTAAAESASEQPAEQAGETAAPASGKVTDISAARPAKKFSQEAIALNEVAIDWAHRLTVVIPQFRHQQGQLKSAYEIYQQLAFTTPLSGMTVEELNGAINLVRTTLYQYANNNPGVAAYLKVLDIIDLLQEGSNEEWEAKRQPVTDAEWALLQMEGNAHLLTDINTQLGRKCAALQNAKLTAEYCDSLKQA